MITVGGLITSTLLTLVVVPVVYSLLDSLSAWTARSLRRLLRRDAHLPAPAASSPPL